MTVSTNARLTSNTLTRILSLLESIKSNDAGAILYQHIETSLHDLVMDQQQSEGLYQQLLGTLLDGLSQQLPNRSAQQMQLYIAKKSLVAGMNTADLKNCCKQLEEILQPSEEQGDIAPSHIQQSLNTLTGEASNKTAITKENGRPFVSDNNIAIQKSSTNTPQAKTTPCFADLTQNNIKDIHNSLTEQINGAREFNDELARLLNRSFSVISQIDKQADLKTVKQTLLRRYTRLIKMHQDLTTKFDAVDDNLRNIESNSENLNAELTRVHRLGYTDELTSLPNRRAFLEGLNDEISRSRRYNSPLTLALLDLDYFKSVNDKFGHTAGDNILQIAAQHMKAVFRYHDIAARYGGEEFAVIFPNTNIEGANLALNKLQERLGNEKLTLDNNEEIPVPSFSAGLAVFSGEEEAQTFIQRADTALYDAKNNGRCRIEVHNPDTPNWPDLSAEEPNSTQTQEV